MKAATETQETAAVIQLALLGRWLIYHNPDSRRSQRGFPDWVFAHASRGVLFRELKTRTGRMSPEQLHWQAAITAAGGDYAVWTLPDDMPLIQQTLLPKEVTR